MIRRVGGLAHESVTQAVIGAFFESYNGLGDGFLESIYATALQIELEMRGHEVAREFRVQVRYKGNPISWQRLDMVVDGLVVVEIKAGRAMPPEASKQLLNYLRATNLEVGLLLHYGPKPRFYREYCANRSQRSMAVAKPDPESDPVHNSVSD